jgi:hypothetical protein
VGKTLCFFTFGTSVTPSNLEKLREDVLDFNEMYKLIGLFDRISGERLFSCCFGAKSYAETEVSSLLRHSGIKSRFQTDDLSVEDVKILEKENCLKKQFNSKRVWILGIGSESTLHRIKF